MMITGSTIRAFRLALGWSRRDMADAIPVDVRSLKRWENECVGPSRLVRVRIQELMQKYPSKCKELT